MLTGFLRRYLRCQKQKYHKLKFERPQRSEALSFTEGGNKKKVKARL